VFARLNAQRSTSRVHYRVTDRAVVEDVKETISRQLLRWSISGQEALAGGEPPVHLIVTTGGTGFTARDVTPEATRAVIEKEAAGLVTAMLVSAVSRLPSAMLSRAVCGIRGRTLVVNLPGSPKAVTEYLDVLFPTAAHGIKLIQNVHDMH
jgi:molybdopterin adenylyltransferase